MYELFIDYRDDWGELHNRKYRSFKSLKSAINALKKHNSGHIQKYRNIIAICKNNQIVFQD